MKNINYIYSLYFKMNIKKMMETLESINISKTTKGKTQSNTEQLRNTDNICY